VSERSARLRAVAERVAMLLPGHVEDVVLTGSTSRETADELSDVELLVISETLPEELPLDELQTWSPGVEGALWFGGLFEGEYVELVWWTPAYVEDRVAGLAAGRFVDHQRLRTAEAIVNGIPLRGDRHVGWCARLASYPKGLAAAIVDDVADTWIEPVRSQTSLHRPGDSLVLAERLIDDAQRLLQVVFALNETWEPGWKRLPARLEPLTVKPERLAERIDAAIRALDLQAMRSLAAEALALAPQTEKTRRARELLLEPL
jgi:nucleotidyltransferase-like protein